MTKPRRLDLRGDSEPDLEPVLTHLERGLLLAYPTETVYGLGGPATKEGIERVQRLKRRGADRPLLVLVPDRTHLEGLRWTEAARVLADAFWPGALTLVLDDPAGTFPPGVRSPRTGNVGVRVSPHPLVDRLLRAFQRPLTSTSLNEPGERSAVSGAEATEVAQRLGGGEILVLDTGTLPTSAPSTLVDCTGDVPVVLRGGSIPLERLRCVIPEIHEPIDD